VNVASLGKIIPGWGQTEDFIAPWFATLEAKQMSAPYAEYSRNMRLIGHSDQGGRPDGVQLMVHRGFAYIGHMVSQGFSIVDVRDPKNRKRQAMCRAARHLERAFAGA
jgi:hypothetical protein